MSEIKFRALRTFESVDLRSTYVEGMYYTVREGNELLFSFVSEWLDAGLVEIVDDVGAAVGGSGLVR